MYTPSPRLSEFLASICGPDDAACSLCQRQWDSVGKPLGSLGLLEESLCRVAALTGSAEISLSPRRLLVFCADNGVVAEGVSQTGPEVTALVARALAGGTSSACVFARRAGAEVIPVDVGILDMPPCPGLLRRRVVNGTGNIARGPALTADQTEAALWVGIDLARQAKEEGVRLLAVGEMGIGNTTTASALATHFLGLDAGLVTGRGAGLSDEGLARKKAAVARALEVNQRLTLTPLGALGALGGADIAAMAGVVLGGAAFGVPVLLDGFISAAAALAAVRLCPACAKALLASHRSAEPAGGALLSSLGLAPLITARLRLGEGTGALLALPLLDMALDLYHGTPFEEYGMEPYTPQS